MKQYVLDANILFSGLLSQKAVYRALFGKHTFYTPDFVLAELNNYRTVLLKKSAVKGTDLRAFTLALFAHIIVVPDYIITTESYERATALMADIDPKDVAYVALSIELDAVLLTRDKLLWEGLLTKGYEHVQLFSNFIYQQTANGN